MQVVDQAVRLAHAGEPNLGPLWHVQLTEWVGDDPDAWRGRLAFEPRHHDEDELLALHSETDLAVLELDLAGSREGRRRAASPGVDSADWRR